MSPKSNAQHKTLVQTYQFVLVLKSWQRVIPRKWTDLIMAEALNYCVYHENLCIRGYLIEEIRVFLIIESNPKQLQNILNVFARQVAKGIYKYERSTEKMLDILEDENLFDDLFFKYPLYDPFMKELLTGKNVYLYYYSPYLAKLKDTINHSKYCSAIDYSGAIGPVVVLTK